MQNNNEEKVEGVNVEKENELPDYVESDDIVTDWWKKYYDADVLDRAKMIENLGLVNDMINMKNLTMLEDDLYKHSIITFIQCYFDDACDVLPNINKHEEETIKC
jgi:hypothetical protein